MSVWLAEAARGSLGAAAPRTRRMIRGLVTAPDALRAEVAVLNARLERGERVARDLAAKTDKLCFGYAPFPYLQWAIAFYRAQRRDRVRDALLARLERKARMLERQRTGRTPPPLEFKAAEWQLLQAVSDDAAALSARASAGESLDEVSMRALAALTDWTLQLCARKGRPERVGIRQPAAVMRRFDAARHRNARKNLRASAVRRAALADIGLSESAFKRIKKQHEDLERSAWP